MDTDLGLCISFDLSYHFRPMNMLYTPATNLAEVQGIEPSTLRWQSFQDSLSTLLAYLQYWSEWQDSNLRPSAPKADALPDCATLGYSGSR